MISFKKAAAGILSIALLAGMFLPVNSRAEGQGQEEAAVATRSVSALSVETPDNGVLTYEYGRRRILSCRSRIEAVKPLPIS